MYNFKAIPTRYRDIHFRSRTEAKWAAFFDLCGIDWQYEPAECDRWFPDFIIGCGSQTYLVEVKPIWFRSISDSDQIVQSQLADTFEKCHDATLCLGLGPCEAEDENGFAWSNVVGYQKFIGRDVYQTQEKYYPIGFYKPGVLSFLSQFSRFEPIDLMPYWEKAQNKTQWKPSNEKVVDLLNLGALSAS